MRFSSLLERLRRKKAICFEAVLTDCVTGIYACAPDLASNCAYISAGSCRRATVLQLHAHGKNSRVEALLEARSPKLSGNKSFMALLAKEKVEREM